jgi:hypothetical protein
MVVKAKLILAMCGLGLIVLALAACGGNGSSTAVQKAQIITAYEDIKADSYPGTPGDSLSDMDRASAQVSITLANPELIGKVIVGGSPGAITLTDGSTVATIENGYLVHGLITPEQAAQNYAPCGSVGAVGQIVDPNCNQQRQQMTLPQ